MVRSSVGDVLMVTARADGDTLKLDIRGCDTSDRLAICRMMLDCACVLENSATEMCGTLSSAMAVAMPKPVDLPSLRPVSTAPMPT